MPKISYYLRNSTVYIRHAHYVGGKSSDFTRSTQVKVDPRFFDTETGKVSSKLPQSVEYNEIINALYTDIAKASRNIIGWDEEPTRQLVEKELNAIVAGREVTATNLPIIKAGISRHIDKLHAKQADLEFQLAETKKEIMEWELINGDHDKATLIHFIKKYAGVLPNKKEGTARQVGEKNLRDATIATYGTLIEVIKSFNHSWLLTDVNNVTLKDFENYMLNVKVKDSDILSSKNTNYKNSTVLSFVRKIKSVTKHYAESQQLDLSKLLLYKTDITDLDDRSVVMLTREELDALEAMELPTDSQRRVRDLFILMAKTSLRFSDLWLKPANIKGKFIEVRTKKKGKIARIPICKSVRIILERYNNTVDPIVHSYFNKTIKKIGKKLSETVETLAYTEQVSHKNRVDIDTDDLPKYELLSAHVARKTFVSLALASKVNPASVKGFTTHSKMDTMLTHYGNKHVNAIEEMNKVFEM
jgi:integrase